MSILIKGGEIITAEDDFVGDVLIDGETIAAIGEGLDVDADAVIDAAGAYVMPGGIDAHTHMVAEPGVGQFVSRARTGAELPARAQVG
jgi:dihydropyrimidinase